MDRQADYFRLSAEQGLIYKFLVLFLKLIMVATMLTIKQDNTISNHAFSVNTFWTNFFMGKIDHCT